MTFAPRASRRLTSSARRTARTSRTAAGSTPDSRSAAARARFSRRRRGSSAPPLKRGRQRSRSRRPRSRRTTTRRRRRLPLRLPRRPDRPARQPRAPRRVRAAVPLVYFIATGRAGTGRIYPCYVTRTIPSRERVLVSPGRMVGPLDERDPCRSRIRSSGGTPCARRASACTRRASAARPRGVLEPLRDLPPEGAPAPRRGAHRRRPRARRRADRPNGLSLCSIHHRAFDQNLVGISPDYKVHVSQRLLEDEDGPMLELLEDVPHAHDRAAEPPSLAARSRPARRTLRPVPRYRVIRTTGERGSRPGFRGWSSPGSPRTPDTSAPPAARGALDPPAPPCSRSPPAFACRPRSSRPGPRAGSGTRPDASGLRRPKRSRRTPRRPRDRAAASCAASRSCGRSWSGGGPARPELIRPPRRPPLARYRTT